ncbi:hypothetical protein THICB3590018 [Thiomonas sp. CB3]|nr:hypothetical protein THICB3590018 [Thiomonas sp. CB3]
MHLHSATDSHKYCRETDVNMFIKPNQTQMDITQH